MGNLTKEIRFVAGITLYNPTQKQLNHIKEYSKSFETVFLFDNTEDSSREREGFFGEGFVYITENTNMGLPYAFNAIINSPECQSFDFLCTLDQDSTYSHESIEAMKRFIQNNAEISKIGIAGPYIEYGDADYIPNENVVKKNWVITSGAFVNLGLLQREHLAYDNNYFIDKFEIDLCQQFLAKGYDVIMYYGAVLYQELGDGNHDHNAMRQYYLFRNRFYFNNKWYSGGKKFVITFLQTAKHVINILRHSRDKKIKIKMLFRGYHDYKNGKMGKNTNV